MSNDNFNDINFKGNLDFREHACSATLRDELIHTGLDTFLKRNKKNMIPHNLSIHLELLLDQKGLIKADVARDSELNSKYVYQIFSGERTPSRDKLIALAFGLHLTADEAQTLLKLARYRELYVRDAIILYALQRGKNITETDTLLYTHGYEELAIKKD